MDHSHRWGLVPVIVLLAGAVLLLAGCDLSPAEPTPLPGQPTDTPPPVQPTRVESEATPAPPAVISLTIWTTESFSPTQVLTAGQVLVAQTAIFEETHPETRLRYVLKRPYGKGGILDFLKSTAAVVPELLPDLVLIDADELDMAVEAGLVQPLDDLLPPDLVADLYPFARQATTFDGQLYGLQVWADLDHLVYNTGKITIPPRSWPGVLSNPGPHIFPAGGQSGLVNDAFLIQYLAVQAQPSGTGAGAVSLDADSLTAVLQYYQDGVSRGIFPLEILGYHSTDDCWRDYLAGKAALTQVSAHRYLADGDRSQSPAVAAIPAINGPASPISRGWVLALVTAEPSRQLVAVDFMVQLLAPEVNAAWTHAADYLPTRQSAQPLWPGAESYGRFVNQQLQMARPRPRLANYAQVLAALQTAVEDVVGGVASPEEAAAGAVASTP